MKLYAFVIVWGLVTGGVQALLARRSERRILQRIDQAVSGVRITGHPAAQRQVARRRSEPAARPVQVD